MRILSVSAQKPDSTGSGVYLAQTVASLARNGHEQAVIYGMSPEDEPILPEGVKHHPVRFETEELPFPVAGMSDVMPYRATRYRDFTPEMLVRFQDAFSHTIATAIQEFQPDLIITHHLYIVSSIVARLAGDIPVAAVCHGTCLRQLEWHDLANGFVREGIALADRVFSLTGPQVDRIEHLLEIDRDRITVLGTGFDDSEFHPRADWKPLSGCERIDALFVGKICDEKGVPSMLRAMDLLELPADRLSLKLVGGSNDEECHLRVSRQAEESRYPVRLLGKVSQSDLVANYREADMLVLPSFYEGLPLVIIEAMACGAVVVCTDLPGIRDWIESVAPDAPIVFVEPPRMASVDEPLEADLPAFEQRLATAMTKACSMEGNPSSVEQLSWDSLAERLLESMNLL